MRANEFLTEDRNSFVADQLGDKLLQAYLNDHGQMPELQTPLDVVNELAKAGPKLVQWLANRYIGGEFKLEDLSAIKAALERFKQVRAQLPNEHKDLNKLSLGALYRVLTPFNDKEVVSNKQVERQKKEKFFTDGDAELLHKDKTLVVITPNTKEASCYFGKGTKWCTAATKSDNYFGSYNKKGPLYIIMTKDDGKFQLHFKFNEFNDAVNEDLKPDQIAALLKKYPKLYDIFDKKATAANYFPLMKNPSEKVQLAAVNYRSENISLIKNPSEAVQVTAVSRWPPLIHRIKNPSEKVQLAAITENPHTIEHIKNPTDKVQLAAVTQYGIAIKHIKNPDEKIQLAAVNSDPFAIIHLKNPSEKIQLAAVQKDGQAIDNIKNPSEKIQLAAIKEDGRAIIHIKNPSEKVQLAAVTKKAIAIHHIKNPSEKVQLAAVRQEGGTLEYIKNPSEKVQWAAVNQNGFAIYYIKNPSEKFQLAAIKNKPRAINFIDNPTDKVKRAAGK